MIDSKTLAMDNGDVITQLGVETAPGITLAARRCGAALPASAPSVVFLHGFPEGAFVWEPLLRSLAHQVRAMAPSLRGYAPSSMPADPGEYRPRALVGDVLKLIDTLCGEDEPLDLLVAHDWGGALAWNLAAAHPERLRQLLIINSPHPGTFLRELRDNPAQQVASAYMRDLVADGAEQLLSADGFAAMWRFFGRANWMTPALRASYLEQWQAGLTGALNYYRASPLRPPVARDDSVKTLQLPAQLLHVSVPTTVLWGEQDRALLPALLDGLPHFVPRLHIQRLPQASHWLVHEDPQLVLQTIRRLLQLG